MTEGSFHTSSPRTHWFTKAMATQGEHLLLQVEGTQYWNRELDRIFASVGRSIRNAAGRYVRSMARLHENTPRAF